MNTRRQGYENRSFQTERSTRPHVMMPSTASRSCDQVLSKSTRLGFSDITHGSPSPNTQGGQYGRLAAGGRQSDDIGEGSCCVTVTDSIQMLSFKHVLFFSYINTAMTQLCHVY